MVLTYDAYAETLAKEQHRDSEINHLRVKLEAVQEEQNQRFDQVIEMIRYNPKLARLKREVLMTRPLKKK
jgi:hypothetical protein